MDCGSSRRCEPFRTFQLFAELLQNGPPQSLGACCTNLDGLAWEALPTKLLDWRSREMEARVRTAVAGSDRRTNLSLPTVSSEVVWRERHDGLCVDIEPDLLCRQ